MRGGLALCKSKTSVKLLDLEFSQGKYMYMIFSNVHIAFTKCDVIYQIKKMFAQIKLISSILFKVFLLNTLLFLLHVLWVAISSMSLKHLGSVIFSSLRQN